VQISGTTDSTEKRSFRPSGHVLACLPPRLATVGAQELLRGGVGGLQSLEGGCVVRLQRYSHVSDPLARTRRSYLDRVALMKDAWRRRDKQAVLLRR
jgi:hypothetical protein